MLNIVIVDDEPLARQGLSNKLAKHPEIRIAGEADNVAEAAALIQAVQPDGVFLDIQMPGANGFELLGREGCHPKIIFVTAYSEFAVRAFDVDAVDYLLKPVHPERLAVALGRLKTACAQERNPAPDSPKQEPFGPGEVICLRTPERTIVTPMDRIAALEADGNFTRVFVPEETPLMICRLLKLYEEILPNPPFIRLGRSLIVNAAQIGRIEHPSRDEIRLWLHGIPAPFLLGRAAGARLKRLL